MKIARETSKYLIAFCPAHDDQHTPNFYINKTEINGRKKGYAYCFSCGHTAQYSGEWVDSMSKKKTRIEKMPSINFTKLAQFYYQNYRPAIEGKKLVDLLKIRGDTLSLYGIGYDDYDKSYTFPMRDEKQNIIGIQKRLLDGTKYCISGSQLGIFIPGAMSYKDSKKVVITEGWSDAAVVTECGFYGIGLACAITTHDTVVKFLVNHAVDTVKLCPDFDVPGEKSAQKILKLCEQRDIKASIISVEPYKDLRFFYEEYGKKEAVKLLKGN